MMERPGKYIRISVPGIRMAAYVYLALPVVLFFFGWLRLPLAVVFTLLLLIGLFCTYRILWVSNHGEIDHDAMSDGANHSVGIPLAAVMISIALVLMWIYGSGIGGYVWQRTDWHARNAVMHDLLDNKWPVVFPDGSGLVYYLVFWMVPATVGKMVGTFWGTAAAWNVANVLLYIWCAIGLFILVLLLFSFVAGRYGTAHSFKTTDNAKSKDDVGTRYLSIGQCVLILAFILFWGGINLIGQIAASLGGKAQFILFDSYGWSHYQYTPDFACIEWVFNQAIPAWIGTLLFVHARRSRTASEYMTIVLLVMPLSPFAAVGLMLLTLTDVCAYRGKGLFYTSGICMALATLPVFGSYYGINGAMSGVEGMSGIGLYIPISEFGLYDVAALMVFWTAEFLIYAFLIWKKYKRDYLFVHDIVLLLILPFFRIGWGRDFIMRGSMCPFFLLMIYVLFAVLDKDYRKAGDKKGVFGFKPAFLILCVCLFIASLSCVGDIIVTCRNTMDPSVKNVADDIGSSFNTDVDWWNEYMGGVSYLAPDVESRFFYKWLGSR